MLGRRNLRDFLGTIECKAEHAFKVVYFPIFPHTFHPTRHVGVALLWAYSSSIRLLECSIPKSAATTLLRAHGYFFASCSSVGQSCELQCGINQCDSGSLARLHKCTNLYRQS